MAHYLVYVPGLADKLHYKVGQRTALFLWHGSSVRPYYFVPNWVDKTETFTQKLDRLLHTIDHLYNKGHTVSLMAASAGSSMALLAFLRRRDRIHRVVSICGKLHHPNTVPGVLFTFNPAFKASLQAFVRHEHELTSRDARAILLVQAARDSYVPTGDGEVKGAHHYKLPTVGHVFTIMMALTIFRRHIIRFVQQES